ncbi:1310_t:CDS:2 [Funneliformis caledonium]|uniref:1310_t:CDS:1 n=1 Tax=Funneliformis caledonium TaxID=1117310 RepID=A0A9N9A6Q3_9GLOM|nr:1310_t:CDS:2 [Funneliformis caledonium]
MNMKRFYERNLLGIAHKHPGTLCIAKCEIGVYSCIIRNGAPGKYQRAVLVKFHILMLNFLLSLTPDDRIIYAYVALGYIVENKELNEKNEEIEEIDNSEINSFFEEVILIIKIHVKSCELHWISLIIVIVQQNQN